MLKIIVDAMGGDNAPSEIVKGAILSLKERDGFSLVLTGDEEVVKPELDKYKYDATRVELVHCTEVITNDDEPMRAIYAKKDSSLVVGLKMLKENSDVGGFISAGSTGAVFMGGTKYIGKIKGIRRAALCPSIPNVRGKSTLLCDCGANAECRPDFLLQFGIMATAYAKALGVKEPRVGLLTNGTEEHKGDTVHREAHLLLRGCKEINFVGNIEGRDIMYGDVDVAVSDGFSGNIALKAIEGCGKTVASFLKEEFSSSLGGAVSYLFAKRHIMKLKNMLDYSRFGGSIFLGFKKVVVKSHGSSKAKTITASVLQAIDAYRGNLIGTIENMLGDTLIGEEE